MLTGKFSQTMMFPSALISLIAHLSQQRLTEEFQSNACLLSMLSENLKLELFTQNFCGRLVRSARKDDQGAAEHVHCHLNGMEECTSLTSPALQYTQGLF